MNTSTNTIISQVASTITNATSAIINTETQTATATMGTVTEAKFGLDKFIPEQYLGTFGFLNTFEIFGNTSKIYCEY